MVAAMPPPVIRRLRRMQTFLRGILASLICSGTLAAFGGAAVGAGSQGSPSPAASASASQPPAPASTPVPLPDVVMAAQTTSRQLDQTGLRDAVNPSTDEVAKGLEGLTGDIDAQQDETKRTLTPGVSLPTIRELEGKWDKIGGQITGWMQNLTNRATQAQADLDSLALLDTTWKSTLDTVRSNKAPLETTQRVQAVLDQIGRTRKAIQKDRSAILTLQSKVLAQSQRVDEARQTVQLAEANAMITLWAHDSPPIWSPEIRASTGEDLLAEGRESIGAQWSRCEEYGRRQWASLVWFALILCGVAVFFAGALPKVRRRIESVADGDLSLSRAIEVLRRPIAAASVLAFLACPVMFSGAPRLFWAILAAIALVPVVILLRRLIDRHLLPILNAVIVFYLLDHVRGLAAALPIVSRAVLLLEAAGGLAFALWFIRRSRASADGTVSHKTSRGAARLAALLFALAILTNALGYVALTSLLGTATVAAAYLGIVLYAAANIVKSLLFCGLHFWPLASLALVRRHRPLLRRRLGWLISAIASGLWVFAALGVFSLRKPVIVRITAILDATMSMGAVQLSLRGLIAFALTIWLSVLLSRFIRFVLQEDIYERIGLERGSSYAISTISHYVILLVGFLLALSALGVDMTKLTILAGAFGVGVGFGLQNIFNNFFSGIILLLERPIHVGDVIDVAGASGLVTKIGIRASKIRLADNSVLIVPNAQLISGNVTNRNTPSRQAQIDLPVRVAYGSDPRTVINLLKRAAAVHPSGAKDPAPDALLKEFAADGLHFALIVWTSDPAQAPKVQSEIAVEVVTALRDAGIAFPPCSDKGR